MFCHCFLVICKTETNPGKLYFVHISSKKFSLPMFQCLVLHTYQLYNVFESGSNHAIYAQFIVQASLLNNGCMIGLLWGAGTCFATCFYAMH